MEPWIHLWVLCVGCGLLYVSMNARMAYGWWHIARQSRPRPAEQLPPLTVVVCYHNEAAVLPQLLDALSRLSYPHFDVVLVNDRSTDGGPAQVEAWRRQQPFAVHHLHIATTPPDWTARKWALTEGLRAAPHPYVALTDADCAPAPDWLAHLARAMQAGADIVLGCGGYAAAAPAFLDAAVQADTLHTAWLMQGSAAAGAAYMAVGRSMGIHLARVPAQQYLAEWRHLPGGSDDLLLQAHVRAQGAQRVQACPQAFTRSAPPADWPDWLARKTRHLNAGHAYPLHHRLWLLLYAMAPLAAAGSLLWAPAGGLPWLCAGWLLAWTLKLGSLQYAAAAIRGTYPPPYLLLLDIIQYFYMGIYTFRTLLPIRHSSTAPWPSRKNAPPRTKRKTAG